MCNCSHPATTHTVERIKGVTFKVEDMTCGHCVGTIRDALKRALPNSKVSIDLGSHEVTVDGDATRAEVAIRDAGYEPHVLVN